jgi:1,4-dihydroxy-2-naphthoate octaprenyltransferase
MASTLRLRPRRCKGRRPACAAPTSKPSAGSCPESGSRLRYTAAVHPASRPWPERWLYALKPASWPKLGVAALLGQAIGVAATGVISVPGLVVGLAFTVFDLCFVVLVNDWGDQEVDRLKRRLFPESCSPKTIPDRILDARSIGMAGFGAAAAALGVAIIGQELLGRPGLVWSALVCLGLFAAYTLPPLRINYRGGGELLEMIGVGFALPWFHAYLQSGIVRPAGLVLLPGFALMCLSSAMASGLSDVETDRIGGKRTFATTFGSAPVRQAAEGLVLGAMLVWAALPRLAPHYVTMWMVLPPVVVMVLDYRVLRQAGRSSQIDTPYGLATYKRHLHDCIWRGATSMALVVALTGLISGGLG